MDEKDKYMGNERDPGKGDESEKAGVGRSASGSLKQEGAGGSGRKGDGDKGQFRYGFIGGILAWILQGVPVGIILMILNGEYEPVGGNMATSALMWVWQAILLESFIWIPLAIIAGAVARNRGHRAARTFIIASFFVSVLVIGGCFGLIMQGAGA